MAPESEAYEISVVFADEPPEPIGGQRLIDSWPAEVRQALDTRDMFVRPCGRHENCVSLEKLRGSHYFARTEVKPADADLGALWLQDELGSTLVLWEAALDQGLDVEEERTRAYSLGGLIDDHESVTASRRRSASA